MKWYRMFIASDWITMWTGASWTAFIVLLGLLRLKIKVPRQTHYHNGLFVILGWAENFIGTIQKKLKCAILDSAEKISTWNPFCPVFRTLEEKGSQKGSLHVLIRT